MKELLGGVPELEEELGRPGPALVHEAADWPGDVVVLGAGGKTGAGIASMARRALDEAGRSGAQVHAVSRWTDARGRAGLEERGVRTVRSDLSDPAALGTLPDAAVVIHLVGAKFGTASAPEQAWMTNTVLPAFVARRYRGARTVALSTGNVYGTTAPVAGGSRESDEPRPVGDYAVTCRGREQVFTHAARDGATPVALIRLNYAVEPRYGVLADLARTLLAGLPVDLGAGAVNVVWQRYANEVVLRGVRRAAAPEPFVLNLTGPETAGVRALAARLGEALGVVPVFTGEEAATSLLADATLCHTLFGYPDRTLGQLVELQARWIAGGGELWDKPTKFERRDGRF
ncbi:NAD-dependent epimerase/dehydratase family protein [Streptomyces griseus]|uniref:NAD-dependent epimerase/dehydratase family protein n=1 Tax=Streptomyces sp. CMC78 TaxID=3231512 RepID=A0AB33K5C2_9ACTN|nr:NAD-dependent epimerase/dehydratase family protein [Streptomyces sp. ID01-9D]MDX5573447.1 NAD-dependent epimerase/dehydratase family protein [Streptomyces sp. ID01-9D]WSV25341.1 NAD-dependent epimerase/dehydratase family protein [Streptomyces fimicarius]WTC85726.1 NAD-dependent epimerase/dehydratase family protein [Streptomyces griseus]WTD71656.1 NAD-dependent epimerase/dehydratase family protein [Streptomyces griseus]